MNYENLQHVFNVFCLIFCLWMCFRWSTGTFKDSMIKVILFLIALVGVFIELKSFT